jgi:anaerobic dimethyl sulfoxide reductase subunit B (iron-sulfur subunit)
MTGKQLGFFFDADRCVMCHACEVACKATRGVGLGVNWRKVIEIWQGTFPNVSRTFVSLSCLHCANPPCEKACPTGAIAKRAQDGIVVVNEEKCTGCRECLPACPYGIPQFGLDGTMQKCDFCLERDMETACTAPCPAGALFSGTTEDLARIAAAKGGQKLPGGEGPSIFMSNGRNLQMSSGDLSVRLRLPRGPEAAGMAHSAELSGGTG